MPKKLIPANKDPKYQIKESDRHYWHVLITRKTVNKDNPRDVRSDSFVQIFDTANFNRLFRPERLGSKARDYKKAALIDEAVVVHNPELVVDEPYTGEVTAFKVIPEKKAPVQPAHTKRKSSK